MDISIKKDLASNWFKLLQNAICDDILKIEKNKLNFQSTSWKRSSTKDEGGGEYRILKNGKIYDPGRGRVFKSNLYLLDDGTLKVEGCLISICDHEIWQPLVVTINEDGTRTAEPLK